MWSVTFEQRLHAWGVLRDSVHDLPTEPTLTTINAWWFQTPWRAYHLHWDDRPNWPDPWELLSDNLYCDLARGLGILYTIALLDRPDLQGFRLAETDQGNLVLDAKQKYILNWERDNIVNISLAKINLSHSVTQQQIKQQIGL